jgi:hypothetical protein
LNALATKCKIKCNRHPKYNNLVLLKYSMITSPLKLELVRDCRGIILDEAAVAVVSMAFRKFQNNGETGNTRFDWTTATVLEKVDGSLCVLYAYDGAWPPAAARRRRRPSRTAGPTNHVLVDVCGVSTSYCRPPTAASTSTWSSWAH